ncbi:transposable element Tc1 transposase [Trichonephila clavipes]|nr:transposable element Tc1 transposase [Trichonephila clavipes]
MTVKAEGAVGCGHPTASVDNVGPSRVKFEQISVFERGRIVGLREAGLSYRPVAARVQRNSSTIMRVSKQWTDEGRTARKSVSGPRNVTSAREDRRLVRMAQTDRTAFSRQLVAQWSTATGVSLCASSIRRRLLQRGLRARIPLCRIHLTQNYRSLQLHWANVHRSWRADWQQQVQLLWPAYSPDMSPIEHEWDIVGRRIARDLHPVASTDEL